MKPFNTFLVGILLLITFLTGCAETPPSGSSLLVQKIDETGFNDLVKQRDGKILFINIWATWCVPCIEEFPYLIQLADEYRNADVDFVGISADFDDEIERKIAPFLKKQKANFPNYVRSFENDEDFINEVNRDWSGGLPATVIYDKSGNRAAFLLGKKDYRTFKQAIDSVLAL